MPSVGMGQSALRTHPAEEGLRLPVAENPTRAHRGWWLGCGLLLGLGVAFAGRATLNYTSGDVFCNSACHAHPHATQQWIQSAHYANRRGVVVHCTECHLPPGGVDYLTQKARLGVRDAYGEFFRDISRIDWARERRLDRAVTFAYDASCFHCHSNLFAQRLSQVNEPLPASPQKTDALQQREMRLVARRMEAHAYYQRNRDRLHCVNCHLFEGHVQPREMIRQAPAVETAEFPLNASAFQNYTEVVPGSPVKFHMIAVPAGTVEMGSPELGACRQRDTGPAHAVSVNAFWMAQTTVSPRELQVFYADRARSAKHGSTAPSSDGPATPTEEIAKEYADWLSRRTGRTFRLPTEAELEYACIAGGSMPSWIQTDSRANSHLADMVTVNPWGFVGLPEGGEFTLDYPPNAESAGWDPGRRQNSFHVVREPEPAKQTADAGVLSER